MEQTDVFQGEVPTARVHFVFGSDHASREYLNCYAVHAANGLVLVRSYLEAPNALPRAVFNADQVFVEHFGPHRYMQSGSKQPKAKPVPQPEERDTRSTAQKIVDGMSPPPLRLVTEEEEAAMARHEEEAKKNNAMNEFLKDSTPAEEQPEVKKFLESDHAAPKEESSTEENSGSDPTMVVTVSGKFRTSPLPEEEELRTLTTVGSNGTTAMIPRMEPDTRGPDTNIPYAPGELDNRETRRKKVKALHRKPPKPLPGASALVAMALFLSLWFRHTS